MTPGLGAPLMRIRRGDAGLLVYTLPMMLHRQAQMQILQILLPPCCPAGRIMQVPHSAHCRACSKCSSSHAAEVPAHCWLPECSIAGVEMACPTYMLPPPAQAEQAEEERVLVPRQALQNLQERGVAFRLAWP